MFVFKLKMIASNESTNHTRYARTKVIVVESILLNWTFLFSYQERKGYGWRMMGGGGEKGLTNKQVHSQSQGTQTDKQTRHSAVHASVASSVLYVSQSVSQTTISQSVNQSVNESDFQPVIQK